METNGDTPTGEYNASELAIGYPKHSYGPNKRVSLDPTGGNALKAENNGRYGFMIHGGDADKSTSTTWSPLRPTHGCIRLSDDNQKALMIKIANAGGTGKVTVNNA